MSPLFSIERFSALLKPLPSSRTLLFIGGERSPLKQQCNKIV
jgi:hypothetical protein